MMKIIMFMIGVLLFAVDCAPGRRKRDITSSAPDMTLIEALPIISLMSNLADRGSEWEPYHRPRSEKKCGDAEETHLALENARLALHILQSEMDFYSPREIENSLDRIITNLREIQLRCKQSGSKPMAISIQESYGIVGNLEDIMSLAILGGEGNPNFDKKPSLFSTTRTTGRNRESYGVDDFEDILNAAFLGGAGKSTSFSTKLSPFPTTTSKDQNRVSYDIGDIAHRHIGDILSIELLDEAENPTKNKPSPFSSTATTDQADENTLLFKIPDGLMSYIYLTDDDTKSSEAEEKSSKEEEHNEKKEDNKKKDDVNDDSDDDGKTKVVYESAISKEDEKENVILDEDDK